MNSCMRIASRIGLTCLIYWRMKCLQRVLFFCVCGFVVSLVLLLKRLHYEVESANASNSYLWTLRRVVGMHFGNRESPKPKATHDVKTEKPRITIITLPQSTPSPWEEYKTWVESTQLYTKESLADGTMRRLLNSMSTKPIVKALVGYRGTQLKATFILRGEQKVVFKPMRYSRDTVITGNPYSGYDRHNAEIAAFYLDGLLGFRRAPPVTGRIVDLTQDVLPVAEKKLSDTFFRDENTGNVCFYGVCYYCKRSDPACAKGHTMEGSVTLWLPAERKLKTWPHPWRRTYVEGRKARWEINENYCKAVVTGVPYNKGRRLLDVMDTAVFDYLIGNADRHHYETFERDGNDGMLLHLDNAKSFGNPNHDERSILAPIYQCCLIRQQTWRRLVLWARNPKSLGDRLREAMSSDFVAPVLDDRHYDAINRRLKKVVDTIRNCISKRGENNVLRNDGF
ncbi:glycosaminoglycan xylosylkinase-like [Oscarella lobularis]|uniref:glycosaminoglycan xylosylkinase-like n=1 Tax=Oscarella lobularis TaxID=121494 RepID=UPI0033137991